MGWLFVGVELELGNPTWRCEKRVSSYQMIHFYWYLVHSLWSCAHCNRNWWHHCINMGACRGCLLWSPLLRNVCSKTLVPVPIYFSAVRSQHILLYRVGMPLTSTFNLKWDVDIQHLVAYSWGHCPSTIFHRCSWQ